MADVENVMLPGRKIQLSKISFVVDGEESIQEGVLVYANERYPKQDTIYPCWHCLANNEMVIRNLFTMIGIRNFTVDENGLYHTKSHTYAEEVCGEIKAGERIEHR